MYYCFSVLHSSLQALARGVYPATGWDGGPLDSERQKLAGTPLGFRGVVVDVNGDWAEFAMRYRNQNLVPVHQDLCDSNV